MIQSHASQHFKQLFHVNIHTCCGFSIFSPKTIRFFLTFSNIQISTLNSTTSGTLLEVEAMTPTGQ